MKVAVYVVNEVTDEQRVAIAALIDGGGKKRKASAAEMKEWIWQQGAGWPAALGGGDAEDADEDLLGTGTPAPADPDLEDLL